MRFASKNSVIHYLKTHSVVESQSCFKICLTLKIVHECHVMISICTYYKNPL